MHVAVAPNKLGGYVERARFFHSIKEFDSALKDYSRVISLTESKIKNPSRRTFALRLRAGLYSELGNHKAAVADYDKLIQMHPSMDEFYCLRAQEYASSKIYDKAIEDFTKAIELAPTFSAGTAYEGRSKIYEKLGKDALANADRIKASEIKAAPAERNLFKLDH